MCSSELIKYIGKTRIFNCCTIKHMSCIAFPYSFSIGWRWIRTDYVHFESNTHAIINGAIRTTLSHKFSACFMREQFELECWATERVDSILVLSHLTGFNYISLIWIRTNQMFKFPIVSTESLRSLTISSYISQSPNNALRRCTTSIYLWGTSFKWYQQIISSAKFYAIYIKLFVMNK